MGKLFFRVTQIITVLVLTFTICGCSTTTSFNKDGLLPALGVGRAEKQSSETETETDPVVTMPKRGITICVDPGHGFEDGGTGSEFLGDALEKDINLSVANKLKEHLETLGFDVIMTHDGEKFPVTAIDDGNNKFRPEERVSYANSLGDKIDYYVSIHCNAFDDDSVHGAIVYYYDGTAKGTFVDEEAAVSITNSLGENIEDLKVSTNIGPYYVIRFTQVPASLIEMGFVTNQDDAEHMLDDEWQNNFAKAIAEGISDFYTEDDAEESVDDTTDPIDDPETSATTESDVPTV